MNNLNLIPVDPKNTYYKIKVNSTTIIGQYYKRMRGFVLTYLPSGVASGGPSSSRFSLIFTSQQDAQNFLDECKNQNIRMSSGNKNTGTVARSNSYYYPWNPGNTAPTQIYRSKSVIGFGDKLVNIKDFFVERLVFSDDKTADRKLSFSTNVYVPLDACVDLLHLYSEPDSFIDLKKYIIDNFDVNSILKLDKITKDAKIDMDAFENAPTEIAYKIHQQVEHSKNILCLSNNPVRYMFTRLLERVLANLEELQHLTIKSLNTSEDSIYFNVSYYQFHGILNCPNLEIIDIITEKGIQIINKGWRLVPESECPKLSEINISECFKLKDEKLDKNSGFELLETMGLEKLQGNLQDFDAVDIHTLYDIITNLINKQYQELHLAWDIDERWGACYINIMFDNVLEPFIEKLIDNNVSYTIGPDESIKFYADRGYHATENELKDIESLCLIDLYSQKIEIRMYPIFYKKGTEYEKDTNTRVQLFKLVMDTILNIMSSQDFYNDEDNFKLDENKQLYENSIDDDIPEGVIYEVDLDPLDSDDLLIDDIFDSLADAKKYCEKYSWKNDQEKIKDWYVCINTDQTDSVSYREPIYYQASSSKRDYIIDVEILKNTSAAEIADILITAWEAFKQQTGNKFQTETSFLLEIQKLCLDVPQHRRLKNWKQAYEMFIEAIDMFHDEDFMLDENKKFKGAKRRNG